MVSECIRLKWRVQTLESLLRRHHYLACTEFCENENEYLLTALSKETYLALDLS